MRAGRDSGCRLRAGYTIHADPAVQQMASDVLQRCMRALPRQRNALLLGMAAFAARLPEDYPEACAPLFPCQALPKGLIQPCQRRIA